MMSGKTQKVNARQEKFKEKSTKAIHIVLEHQAQIHTAWHQEELHKDSRIF